jgi:hypothetical protein
MLGIFTRLKGQCRPCCRGFLLALKKADSASVAWMQRVPAMGVTFLFYGIYYGTFAVFMPFS